jgi:hypothetical protein
VITSAISDGVSRGPGSCALIVQPFDPQTSGMEFASILLVVENGVVQSAVHPEFIVARIVEDGGDLMLIGRLGQVARLQSGHLVSEQIVGPEDFGFITDARAVGERVFAVGMRRQIYVRDRSDHWSKPTQGVLDETGNVAQVTGFRSVDGNSRGDLIAVGLDGEIWHLEAGAWQQDPSPTNVILEQVRLLPGGDAYVAGQAGVILTGRPGVWSIVEQSETDADFWGLDCFANSVYLATRSELFWIENGALPPKRLEVPGGSSFGRLRSGHGALWSFGPEEARWTIDGKTWQSVDIPKAHSKT